MAELVLQNVQYRYAGSERLALNDVNCSFVGGAFHAVIGPSGSGKTTLLSIMAGLDRPSAGSVLVSGTDLATMDLDAYRRQRVAIIFQAFQFFPLLTAQENVAFTMELNGADKKAAADGLRGHQCLQPGRSSRRDGGAGRAGLHLQAL